MLFMLRNLGFFCAWLAIWQTGVLMEYTQHASVWFPVSGFTFCCFLVLGHRVFLSIFMAAIVSSVWTVHSYGLALSTSDLILGAVLFGFAHILPYWAGAAIINKIASKKDVHTPQLIVSFLLIACVASLLATVCVIASLVAAQQLPMADVEKTLLPFWVGDMAGVVVLAPLFSSVLLHRFPSSTLNFDRFTHSQRSDLKRAAGKIGFNLVLILATMLFAVFTESKDSAFAIFFLAVTHMWIACTESPKVNVVSLATSSVLIVLLVHSLGLMEYAMVYQFAINVIAANALFGIAIPQLQADNKQLKNQVFIDNLTGAFTWNYMQQRAELEIAQSQETGSSVYLVVFDLDNFKSINDEQGHLAGDDALRNVSEQVKRVLRKTDVFARFGGDEFVLLLPATDAETAHAMVEQVRLGIHTIFVDERRLTSSFGLAKLMPDESLEDIFKRADAALYASKRNGGDIVSVSTPS